MAVGPPLLVVGYPPRSAVLLRGHGRPRRHGRLRRPWPSSCAGAYGPASEEFTCLQNWLPSCLKWQAAIYLGQTDDGLDRLIRDGVVPIVKLGGRVKSRVRIRKTDLDALIEASLIPATRGLLAK